MSPPIAGRLENFVELESFEHIKNFCLKTPLKLLEETDASNCDFNFCFTLIEGAGGLFSPMVEDVSGFKLNADLAKAIHSPVILVMDDRLGFISQSLSCLLSAHSFGLSVTMIVLNQMNDLRHTSKEDPYGNLEQFYQLKSRFSLPLIFPYCKDRLDLSRSVLESLKNFVYK